MVWLFPGMFWYSDACTTMMSVRLATRAANMSAMTMSVPVSRFPSETRPSTPVLPCTAESEVVVSLGFHAGSLVARAQQQRYGDEAGQKRRAALADEGQRQAREGDEPGDAADDDERLQHR